jgi:DNA repair exonuclease SbcCD ATPase subunit
MTKEKPGPLRIVSMTAENIKRLKAVHITPSGSLVVIAGRNKQGKTSVLDAIWWAIGGARNVQASPIRNGEERASIKVDMGELIAIRTFTRTEDGYTSAIKLQNGEGATYNKPQDQLNALVGALTFEPISWAKKAAKDQFDELKQFVPEVDFGNIAALNKRDFDKRAELNRKAKEIAGQVAGIAIPAATPGEKVDEAALIKEIGEVGEFNAQIERRKERRTQVAADATTQRSDAEAARKRAADMRAEAERAAEALRKEAEKADAEAAACDSAAAAFDTQLATAAPLPAPKDAAEVTRRLEEAKRTNAMVDQATRRAALQAEQAVIEKQAATLTKAMEDREADKRAKIAAAKMPVPGLTFGDDQILLDGVPFDQASDAEQLRAAIGIAAASNPRLRVIRVRDGSLLDPDSMTLLAEMAETAGFQVWVEVVDASGEVGVVIEDGQVVSTPETRAAGELFATAAE